MINITLIGVIISIILIIILRYLLFDNFFKNKSNKEKVDRYNDTWSDQIIAFTYEKLNNGLYKNYNYITNKESIDKWPVDPKTGEFIKNFSDESNHGNIIYNENGFTISGVKNFKFTCPTPGFKWNDTLKNCEVAPVCEKPGIINLKKYQLFPWSPSGIGDDTIHKRLFGICDNNLNLRIEACKNNELFNTDKLICERYNICEDKPSGYVFQDNTLTDSKEYYECVEGDEIKRKCDDNHIFIEKFKNCFPEEPCNGKNDGYTYEKDSNSYYKCINNKSLIVNCNYGVTKLHDKTLVCKNIDCILPKYPKTFSNEFFDNIKLTAILCSENIPREIDECDKNNILIKITKVQSLYTKREFFNEVIEYPKFSIQYTNDTYTETECIKTDFKKYCVNPYVKCSYFDNQYYYYWNFIEDKPKNVLKYYQYDMEIYDDNSQKIDNLNNTILPFFTTNKLYKLENVDILESFSPNENKNVFVYKYKMKSNLIGIMKKLNISKTNNTYFEVSLQHKDKIITFTIKNYFVLNEKYIQIDSENKPNSNYLNFMNNNIDFTETKETVLFSLNAAMRFSDTENSKPFYHWMCFLIKYPSRDDILQHTTLPVDIYDEYMEL